MKTHKKTTLFLRILIGLTFPLIFLAVTFTGLQLQNQMIITNELYKSESRLAFNAAEREIGIDLLNSSDQEKLKAKMLDLKNSYHLDDICVFTLYDQKLTCVQPSSEWTPLDYESTEKSLYQKQTGDVYHVRVDKTAHKLIAYIAQKSEKEDHIFIVRVTFPLAHIGDALMQSRRTLVVMFFLILLTGFFIGFWITRSIIKPIRALNEATSEIIQGHLGKHVQVKTNDEIETLSEMFNHMSDSLKIMKQRAEDANPLTQLPGNQGIFHELKKRIHERQKFVIFHADLDRFKVFNDHFGLAQGDLAIKKTAELLKHAVKEKGGPDDFVGHQGGDDFVLITRPNYAKDLASYVISHFDTEVVPAVYSREDYDAGYTLEIDRRRLAETGEERKVKFPLLSISLAGLSNIKKDFADYFDCMGEIVPIKKEVKRNVKSCFLIKD